MGSNMATQDAAFGFDAEGMWDSLADAWDGRGEWHAGVTRELTEMMVEELALTGADTLVELACGPTADIATAAVRSRNTATVLAGDLSARMVQAAQRRAQRHGLDISFRQLDVTDLALPDKSVDRLAARWVYMLLPDPLQGLREARRVLHPSGRLVFAVFAAASDNPFFMLPAGVLAEHGLFQPPPPGQPSMFALADVDRTTQLVRDAGFASSSARDVRLSYRLTGPDDLWAMVSDFAGPVSLALRRQDADTRNEIRVEIERRAERFRDGAGYALPGLARIFTAPC